MARTVGIGHQDFGQLIRNNYFYVDKTAFIKEWWESGDAVTLYLQRRGPQGGRQEHRQLRGGRHLPQLLRGRQMHLPPEDPDEPLNR